MIKTNIVDFYQNKIEFSEDNKNEIQYLLKIGMIDIEQQKIILKDPFFSLATLLFKLIGGVGKDVDIYSLGQDLIDKNI